MAKEEYEPDPIRGSAEEGDGGGRHGSQLPIWWVGLFAFALVWGAWVLVDWYHASPHSLASQYEHDMANAAPPIDLDTIEIVVNAETIAAGAEVYAASCVACHQSDASGGIGPSLIDDEWVHGSSPEAIRDTVANGVLEKGMPAWLPVLGAARLATVTAYLYSLANPPAER